MKLYFLRGACSFTPHVVLRELNLPFEIVRVDVATHKTASGDDYLSINPNGYVPALQLDDGQVITECPAIIQYLADLVPSKALAPANGTLARVRMQSWLNFVATELHKGFSVLFSDKAPEAWKLSSKEHLGERLAFVNEHLAKQDYLLDQFSVADVYLYNVLTWTKLVGIELKQWPALEAFKTHIGARASVAEARAAEK